MVTKRSSLVAAVLSACGASSSAPSTPPAPTAPPGAVSTVATPPAPRAAVPAKRWTEFPGPSVAPAAGDPAWVVGPLRGENWSESAWFYLAKVNEAGATELVVEGKVPGPDGKAIPEAVAVPGAFTATPRRGACTVGAAVLFACKAGSSGVYARLAQSERGCEAHWYEGTRSWSGVEGCQWIELDGSPAFGNRVAYREGTTWRGASYIAAGPAPGQAWIFWREPKLVDNTASMLFTRLYKQGDSVWVLTESGTFEPAVIANVVDGGVAYAVRYKDKSTDTVSFAQVTAPLR